MTSRNSAIFTVVIICCCWLGNVKASVNEKAQPIKLAVSNAISGPASQLGIKLNTGANAYFSRINKQGGINGRAIKMSVKDDGYEPFRTLKNTREFLRRDDIFAFFNYVGTPTTYAIQNEIKHSKLPFLTPFTGAEFLRHPVTHNVFNLRASYYQEADAQVEYLVEQRNIKKIGLLVQADEFGRAVERGYLMVLEKYGLAPVVTTRYRRNTQDIETALDILHEQNVEAVAFVGTYKPLAELINSAHSRGFDPVFATVSFVSSEDLFSRIVPESEVVVTEVMPDPNQCDKTYCLQFIDDMKAIGIQKVDRVHLEGYLNAYLFVSVLKQCQDSLTSSCFLQKIEQLDMDEQGLRLKFSALDHQGLADIYLNHFPAQPR